MASARDPDDLLRSNAGKENFQRLTRLLITGGTALLRELFDMFCPPNDLPKLLKNPTIMNHLKAAKLTKPERDCLYPSMGVYGKSVEFDVTLLFRLLRALCGLIPPATGWDALPVTSDYSLEADLARIKYYRNTIYGHVSQNMEISDATEFLSLWKEISEALVRIAGHISHEKKTEWQKAIDNFLTDPLTDEDKRNVEELLTWYRSDVEVKKSIEKLETTTQEMKEQMGELHQSVDQLGKLHQSMDRKLTALTESPREGGQLRFFFFICFQYYRIKKSTCASYSRKHPGKGKTQKEFLNFGTFFPKFSCFVELRIRNLDFFA